MTILVTGGAGYIGSHTCVCLLEAGYQIVIADNFSNSNAESIKGIERITGKSVLFYEIDIRNREDLRQLFEMEKIDAVIHFAGYKAVEESVRLPLKYYDNNLVSAITLLEVMQEYNVKNFVFSSSAAVYGNPETTPVAEDFPLLPVNPYGSTKLMIEQILYNVHLSDPSFKILILRYFNPVGAHGSGLIGEESNGVPNNLFPYITMVAAGELSKVMIFGNNYKTADGTGVRDYIHVMDLAEGHLAALEHLEAFKGFSTYNLGTGIGYSVFDAIRAFEHATGRSIPYEVTARRMGDTDECYANPDKAFRNLKWKAKRGLTEMCQDAWMFKNKHL